MATHATDDDLDKLLEVRRFPWRTCRVAWALAELPADTAGKFAVLIDSNIPASIIADRFQARDLDVQGESVRRHRNGRCKCTR